jgi:Zn-dependent M32 family carboxypeptidase
MGCTHLESQSQFWEVNNQLGQNNKMSIFPISVLLCKFISEIEKYEMEIFEKNFNNLEIARDTKG